MEHYENGKVYHTSEGVNLDASEAYAFFNIFKSAWKNGEIFNLSPYMIAHYVSGYGEVLNIVSVREEDDGRRTAGKGIMLKGFEISTMCARIDDVRMQFTEHDTSLAAVNVKLDDFFKTMNSHLEASLNTQSMLDELYPSRYNFQNLSPPEIGEAPDVNKLNIPESLEEALPVGNKCKRESVCDGNTKNLANIM